MDEAQKKKNRIKSYICIAVFLASLVVAGVIGVRLVQTIVQSNTLQAIKGQLIEEKNKLQDGEEKDCYTVYVKDDYTLVDGEIYIFQK